MWRIIVVLLTLTAFGFVTPPASAQQRLTIQPTALRWVCDPDSPSNCHYIDDGRPWYMP